ncbi:MAG TPA: ribosome maturation factor RimM [Aquabacterium sp.]|uniref:ribosome maturation factor RimM n=1 Tax=Aquabacterium sp. TaxID=1872578 RepID=UPI002E36CBC2|nr:ribosome maturation factor RimM [Aquabacterium sp.]HEX5373451.1 ribosome maturation factor RimM [Aquabacterium sp.]
MTDRAAVSSQGVVLADGTPWPEDAIEVARIIDAWGVKGGIKVTPFSSDPQALFCTKKWFVRPAEAPSGVKRPAAKAAGASSPKSISPAAARLTEPRLLRVKTVKEQGDVVVATLDEVADRSAAEALKGARVFVSRSAFPTPDEDEFYWVDLIGLQVINREGQPLGEVVDLLDTGPHCVLRCVLPAEGAAAPAERLIPFVSAYIDKVSLADKQILVDWGLDY